MEPSSLGPLAQYGAVGVVAGLLLLLVIGMFKSLVDSMIKTNKELQQQNFELQQQTLTALNGIRGEIVSMKTELGGEIRELDHTVANMFNELSSVTGSSRGYALGTPIRPRQR